MRLINYTCPCPAKACQRVSVRELWQLRKHTGHVLQSQIKEMETSEVSMYVCPLNPVMHEWVIDYWRWKRPLEIKSFLLKRTLCLNFVNFAIVFMDGKDGNSYYSPARDAMWNCIVFPMHFENYSCPIYMQCKKLRHIQTWTRCIGTCLCFVESVAFHLVAPGISCLM